MYNVAYDHNGNTKLYCIDSMDHAEAERQLNNFIARYVGKPYPNGKGFYPFTNVRIVRIK